MISPPRISGHGGWKWPQLCCAALLLAATAAMAQAPPDFATQVRPILEQHCQECHGAASRKAGLSLLSRADAETGGDSGLPALVAHQPGESLLMQRVLAEDPEKRMPKGRPALALEQIAVLRQWIASGASWGEADAQVPVVTTDHWAFYAPVQAAPPTPANAAWGRTPVDAFVAARLEKEGLAPSPEADRNTLLRRLSLDLTGLPPQPAEIEAFLSDALPDAYERIVDRLLASPHYGELRALGWLDAARYADTNGFEKDRARSIWPYRDWVIRAFNNNMPFDQFVREQLAGDLMAGATQDDLVATGFLRNSMLNEEGGVDAEEYRYEAMVDRVNTVSTVFLGLTMACAQCHSHKYDPITQREYFQFMAFLNNTNDVPVAVKTDEITRKREEIAGQIAALENGLAERFPPDEYVVETTPAAPACLASATGMALASLEGAVVAASGAAEKDTYTLVLPAPAEEVIGVAVEAIADPALPQGGAGLGGNGNFVLSEVRLERAQAADLAGGGEALAFRRSEADYSQPKFEVEKAIDGKPDTGWSVDGAPDGVAHTRKATFWLKQPVLLGAGEILGLALDQQQGDHQLLGRFRCSLITRKLPESATPEPQRQEEHLARKIEAWEAAARAQAQRWTVLNAIEYRSKNHASFVKKDDGSLLLKGDIPNTDTYDLGFFTDLEGITAIRLEVLPDPSLPGGGPGRGVIMTANEGDFLLSEIAASIAPWGAPDQPQPLALQNPTQDFAGSGREAALALDGKMDTGWSVAGGEGKPHWAVFELAQPAGHAGGVVLRLKLDQYYVHQHTIGRLRVSVTADPPPVRASTLPAEIEAALLVPKGDRSAEQQAQVKQHFLRIAPELDYEHLELDELRSAMPKYATSLALEERDDPRATHVHHRGEFLSPREAVEPGAPAVLHDFPESIPRNRLSFAAWLTSKENPLLARVTVNRLWQNLFGRGLVATVDDFGVRGDLPAHPELLDWLAVEFMRRDWNVKDLERLIVSSSVYRQSSRVPPELHHADPTNELLARGPAFRVDAETIRDIALSASGLLSPAVGGPSVYPPMPKGFLNLTFGGGGAWPESQGGDRYRRGLYTYIKRTMPYPTASVFDAPARDSACVRRVRSNTPLQALTMLNDGVFMEAAASMADRVLREAPPALEERIRYAFLLALSRPPDDVEVVAIKAFYESQLNAGKTAQAEPALRLAANTNSVSDQERHAWLLICRALLNLDETITKN